MPLRRRLGYFWLRYLPIKSNTLTGVDAKLLAEAYIEKGIVGEKWLDDAIHVANASLAHVDCIVSWNFKHIVRLDRIRGFNAVNFSMNHGALTILSPKEVLLDES